MTNSKILADLQKNVTTGYFEILESINRSTQYIPAFQTSDLKSYLVNLLVALKHSRPIVLLDSDFSEHEISKLQIEYTVNNTFPIENSPSRFQFKDIINSQSIISLFTSGTTGMPKRIDHTVQSLMRLVRIGDKYKDNVWGLAYNPTHMAGIQVIMQALINENSLIYLFNADIGKVQDAVDRLGITHLSATPTFYRMLTNLSQFNSVLRVTVGGEKSDNVLYQALKKTFPNAVINNIYASTEVGSLLVSHDNLFSIPEKFQKVIRIKNNELQVHKDILMHMNLEGLWYSTGDIVEVVSADPMRFKIVGRKNEMINIGGYKVNPQEIEEIICEHPMVLNAFVYGKANSVMGNILCADIHTRVYSSDFKNQIISYLKSKIQDYKVPRIINLKELNITRTGKLSRKS